VDCFKRKTKEDTWKSDELRKHLGSLEPGFQPEDKYRERRKHRDGEANGNVDSKERRHRDRDKERKTEKYKDREREKYRQTDRDKDQRKDGHKERYREKESDSDKGKDTEKHRDRDQVRVNSDLHQLGNHSLIASKSLMDQENTGSHRKLSRSRDEDNEQRHREHRDREQSLHNDRARRQQEKKDLENEERGRKHRERGDSLREFSERKHGDSKEQTRESTDKDRERRHRERIDLEDDERQRRHRERRERKERKEKKEDYENSYHKRSEVNLKEEEGGTNSVYQRNTEKQFGKNKSESFKISHLCLQPAPNQLRSTWRSSQRQLSDEENAGEEIVGEKTAIPEVQEETMTYSEEGFEDYDDDFEVDNSDDDGHGEDEGLLNKEKEEPNEVYSYRKAEVEEVQKAIIAENERIGLMQSQSSQRIYKNESKRDNDTDLRVTSGKGSQCGTFIDFVTAKQRQISQKAVRKQKKRSAELLRLIDLDFSVSFTLLDLPPVNEYDMYIKSFGRTNTKQAYVQCNEDNIDRDVQTEEIETVEKWTQHPGESAIVCGGLSNSDALSVDSQSMLNVDSQRLTTFLRSASQVVAVLLEEDQAEKQSQRSLRSEATSLSIADGCFQLNTNLSFLQNREVDCLNFSQVQRQMFLSVHGFPKTNSAVRLDSKYIICVWNIWEPSSPQKVLVCESKIQCCCFSPGKATLVFAGTVDGSVVLWDLREPGNLHHCMKIGAQDWTFRNPTFSTVTADAILAAVSHSCPVQAVEPVSSIISEGQRYSSSPLAPQEEMSGLSFQIASLDEEGLLNLWVASELPKADLAGSRTDLGLIPGGKVKLLHSSAININSSFFPRDIIQLAPPQMLNIRFLPCDPNHFIVGTDMQLISINLRIEKRKSQQRFSPQSTKVAPSELRKVDASLFIQPIIFLVGCSDGSIRVHEMNTEYPTMQWRDSTDGQPIIAMQWSLTRPAVFFVLDAVSTIHVWDLLENDLQPVSKECVQTDGVTMMAVLGEPEKPSALSCLVLAKQSGTIEVQCIKNKWAISQREELEKLHYVLHNIA
uniref:Dynein 2 intermediate chain 1 n=1 Tax=Latimeria chalumnae TaxID=7897 RepID=H2ZUZ2_LATCH